MNEPFFFGIPLIARQVCGDWPLVEHLLGLTLRSILAQDQADFRVLLAGHDVPAPFEALRTDPRFTFVAADWAPLPPTQANDDGGAKKWLIKQHVRQEGGGLLMFLDADDWVARPIVRTARAAIWQDAIGALVADGFALDYQSGRVLRFPISGAFDGRFDQLCGSSTIARIVPASADPWRNDPHHMLGSHHQWPEAARRAGASLARIDLPGVYLIGTGVNHSERDGPYATWRDEITAQVRRRGAKLDARLAASFGLSPADLTRSSDLAPA